MSAGGTSENFITEGLGKKKATPQESLNSLKEVLGVEAVCESLYFDRGEW